MQKSDSYRNFLESTLFKLKFEKSLDGKLTEMEKAQIKYYEELLQEYEKTQHTRRTL